MIFGLFIKGSNEKGYLNALKYNEFTNRDISN